MNQPIYKCGIPNVGRANMWVPFNIKRIWYKYCFTHSSLCSRWKSGFKIVELANVGNGNASINPERVGQSRSRLKVQYPLTVVWCGTHLSPRLRQHVTSSKTQYKWEHRRSHRSVFPHKIIGSRTDIMSGTKLLWLDTAIPWQHTNRHSIYFVMNWYLVIILSFPVT